MTIEPMQADEPPIVRGDAPRGLFTPRWEELQQTCGILNVVGDELTDDITGWFDDL